MWFSTTAPDSTLYTVSWGNAAGAPRHCLDVLSDGVDRGWAFFEGIAVRCDGSGTPTDADGLDTNLRGKLWCHNCPVQVIAADGSDNVATAHAGGVTVISGVSPLTLASGASGTNPAVATTGSSAVVIVSRSSIRHLQATYHTADVVLAACGGQCTPAPDGHTPAVALIGPRLECGSGCGGGSSLLELNPDPVAPVSPRATASGLVAFTRFDHARSEGTHAIRAVLDAPNVGAWFRGYGNEYLTLDSVWLMWGTQLDPGSDLDVEDVGFVANEPAGGPGEDAAILYCADPDWRTAVSNLRLADYQFDNGGGADSQCYLEAGAVDVISASMDGCQSGIDAVAPSGTWSVDGAGDPAAAGLFAQDLPSGIVLPDFVTGRRLAGVYFGGEIPAAIDVEPDDPANRIDVHYAGTIPVALLGSDAFDPAQVDATTLAFAPDFAAPADAGGPALDDVDGDGRLDLLSHYAMQDTGIALGDTEACLTGRLLDGRPFEGCDVIVILGSPGTGCGLGPELAPLIALLGGLRRRRARHRS